MLSPFRGLLSTIVVLTLISAGTVQAYSYAEKEDPMTLLFKAAVVAAKEGQWEEVSHLAQKGVSMQKGHMFKAGHLAPKFEEAIGAKNLSKTAETFANLVYISIREKLRRNITEKFSNYKNAKARLQLARKSYVDVLDGNVKKKDAKSSSLIMSQFNIALGSIGNPGLFGIGKKSPDAAGYERSIKTIESQIVKIFPSFAE